MVSFKHHLTELSEAFNVSLVDKRLSDELVDNLINATGGNIIITKYLERVWADERISDNAKCFLIFQAGRYTQYKQMMDGGIV